MHVMQFGSGCVYAEPVAGNSVSPTSAKSKRLRTAIFGSRVEVVEIKLDRNPVTRLPGAGKMVRIEVGPDGLPPGTRTFRHEWEKPDWMKRIAARFKPRHSGGRG
jgi:hypothetical protein